jgi:hypothetical protein
MIYALTGINWEEMQDLLRHGLKTFELVSGDHTHIALSIKTGDRIFIANQSKQDIKKGVEGILADVRSVKVEYWRITPREFDEKEVLTARIQVSYLDHGRVKTCKDAGPGQGLQVDVDTHAMLG